MARTNGVQSARAKAAKAPAKAGKPVSAAGAHAGGESKPKAAGKLLPPWKPGQSGNPGGRPKLDPEFKRSVQALCPEAVAVLVEVMRDKHAQASARVKAAEAILNRGYGTPAQSIALTDPDGSPLGSILQLTAEERSARLAAILAKAAAE